MTEPRSRCGRGSSFLPAALPQIAGWQLAATLQPARQTSGDFFDVLELPGGRLGLVIADVTDKGTGAALFMALSRTLIRTFAFEYPDQPAKALHAANKRILTDSRSSTGCIFSSRSCFVGAASQSWCVPSR